MIRTGQTAIETVAKVVEKVLKGWLDNLCQEGGLGRFLG